MIQRPPLFTVLMSTVVLALALSVAAPAQTVFIETVTNTADSGAGSLRSAILNANSDRFNPTEIRFNIPGDGPFTIRPLTQLPEIFAQIFILGNTQPGTTDAPLIEIDGSLTRGFIVGLIIRSDDSLIRGLTVGNFPFIGIAISEASRVTVEGCRIGTNIDGTQANPNPIGLLIDNSPDCQIGGPGAGQGNLISGNESHGIALINTFSRGNVIQGNLIGTDVSGNAPLPNKRWGILVATNTRRTIIGGKQPGEGNVISANGDFDSAEDMGGIFMGGDLSKVQGNLIGLGRDGTTPLGNFAYGVRFDSTNASSIGGPTSPERNVISETKPRSTGGGLGISLVHTVVSTRVQGNFIGTDVTGTEERGNNIGVTIFDTQGTVFGGTGAGEGNLISGSSGTGLSISGDNTGMQVQGNLIGTDVTGLRALGNERGISLRSDTVGAIIGGVGGGNVIAGNRDSGLYLNSIGSGSDQILGNFIGVGIDGVTPLGNELYGVEGGGSNRSGVIGTTSAGNIIAHNGKAGVRMRLGGNFTIRGNRIFSNADLGIDWFTEGVTQNDDESDDVPNFPLITGAAFTDSGIGLSGSLDTLANTDVTLDFYLSPTCDPSGHGEGWKPIATLSLTTGSNGTASFNETFLINLETEGRYVTATSTSFNGRTSEFSRCVRANGRGPSTQEIVDFLLDLIPDPGDLNLNTDGVVDSADVVTNMNAPPG